MPVPEFLVQAVNVYQLVMSVVLYLLTLWAVISIPLLFRYHKQIKKSLEKNDESLKFIENFCKEINTNNFTNKEDITSLKGDLSELKSYHSQILEKLLTEYKNDLKILKEYNVTEIEKIDSTISGVERIVSDQLFNIETRLDSLVVEIKRIQKE